MFDHTADMGLRVWGATLPELIQPAGDGLYAVIGELYADGPDELFEFTDRGSPPEELLRDYLQELLFLFERRFLVRPETAVFDERGLVVRGWIKPIDPGRSMYHHEVKAITYHELNIRPIAGGFEATVIVDV